MSISSIFLTVLLAFSVKTGAELLSCTSCVSTSHGSCLFNDDPLEEMDCSTFKLENTNTTLGDLAQDEYTREYVERLYQAFQDNPGKVSNERTCAYISYYAVDLLGTIKANLFVRGCMPSTFDESEICVYAKSTINMIHNVTLAEEGLGCGTYL